MLSYSLHTLTLTLTTPLPTLLFLCFFHSPSLFGGLFAVDHVGCAFQSHMHTEAAFVPTTRARVDSLSPFFPPLCLFSFSLSFICSCHSLSCLPPYPSSALTEWCSLSVSFHSPAFSFYEARRCAVRLQSGLSREQER